ncbi:MAG: hypothetical protein IJO74_02985 [Clostridia bacterium]|nr:hypothetical protein [Clostridia bacterium]
MKKTKIIALIFALVVVVGVFASCNRVQKRIAGVEITVTGPDKSIMASGLVTVEGVDPTVMIAIEQFLLEQEMNFTEDSYGNTLVIIGDVDNSDPNSEYIWSFKLNGKDPDYGMAAELVYDKDKIDVYCMKNPFANAEKE